MSESGKETPDVQKSLYWFSYGATLSGMGCWAFPFSNVPKLKALSPVVCDQLLTTGTETSRGSSRENLLLEIANLELN